ncbi:MAG: hypothetical protein ACLRM6_07700 [Christensenellales bacterium]
MQQYTIPTAAKQDPRRNIDRSNKKEPFYARKNGKSNGGEIQKLRELNGAK